VTRPTLEQILQEFEREIARAPRFASVDRDLLARVCGACREMQQELEDARDPVLLAGERLEGRRRR